ncbi:hypothetical protein R1sor_015658 [Riccia sorocarpa]|uniref:Ribosomal protein S4 n=1 Tax=Riccia sorocarpa TaxID=122646 RepID=A0ABD3HGT1_9MARC
MRLGRREAQQKNWRWKMDHKKQEVGLRQQGVSSRKVKILERKSWKQYIPRTRKGDLEIVGVKAGENIQRLPFVNPLSRYAMFLNANTNQIELGHQVSFSGHSYISRTGRGPKQKEFQGQEGVLKVADKQRALGSLDHSGYRLAERKLRDDGLSQVNAKIGVGKRVLLGDFNQVEISEDARGCSAIASDREARQWTMVSAGLVECYFALQT